MTEPTNDNPPLSLGAIIASLPAVKVAKKANTMSRVHRRLIEPIETEQDNELAFQHSVFCQTSLPYRNPGDDVRLWQRSQRTSLWPHCGVIRSPAKRSSAG